MIEFGGKKLCENCFSEVDGELCPECGYNAQTSGYDPMTLKPGSILRGKYIVGKCLGKGGFGITYLAYDTKSEITVAIKEFFPFGQALRTGENPTVSVSTEANAAAFKTGAEKFYDEAKLVSRFNGNPNIVAVHEFFYENDTVYFAMEYLSGRTLKDYIQQNGTLNVGQALFIAQNVSNALMVAHSASVLHRDISPDNIMLCDNGEIKIIDFGAARQVMAERSQTFSVILKPGFAPLEQYQKKGKQGPWTDIYSLGATLYYALTGQIPDDPMSRQEEDDTFAENKFGVNEELWEIIVKATMLRIPDRYQDIFELRKDLDRVSFAPELIVTPTAQESAPRAEFRTAMPYGATTATVQHTATAQPQITARTEQAAPAEKPESFFAKNKKLILAFSSSAAVVAVAAAIIAVALNSGGKQPTNGLIDPLDSTQNSYVQQESEAVIPTPDSTATSEGSTENPNVDDSAPSKPEVESKPAATTTTKSTPKAESKPESETESKSESKPKVTTPATTTTKSTPKAESKPEVESKPKVTTSATTTTKSTPKPVESKPEEVKEITIKGETYSTSLTELDLTKKGLTDSDVKDLKYMTNLTTLILDKNNLTDISFVKEMPNLKKLTFTCNNVSDISALKGLSKFEHIYGYENPISDLSALEGMKTLKIVDLGKTNVSDLSPLSSCPNITRIYLFDCNISDISPLAGVKKLSELRMENNRISDISPLKQCVNLSSLSLENNQISDISPLKHCVNLSSLYMNNNYISDVSPLKSCNNLTYVYLENNCICETSINSFSGLSISGSLNIKGNGLTGEQAQRISNNLKIHPGYFYY